VIGIVAQRIAERFHRPSLVIGIENGEGVGSGRSIKSFHLLDGLTAVGDLFTRFGGHAQAAGFSVAAENIPELARRFEAHARGVLALGDLEPVLRVDATLNLSEVDWPLYEQLLQLEPFGMGNPTPVFGATRARVMFPPRILKEKHLKLRMEAGPRTLDALGWGLARRAPTLDPGQLIDLAFTLDKNTFQDRDSLQLIVKDIAVDARH
jgi:single-stranded-DNA-specific exonuclease